MLVFNVPPGIGDISWLYAKLRNLGRPFQFNICENRHLNRASGFVDILPGVVNGGYKNFSYHDCFIKQDLSLPPETDMRTLPDGEYYLSANKWVDQGHRIEEFLPSLPMTYHYPMNIPAQASERIQALFKDLPKPIIGIYTSKYNAPQTGWHFWNPEQWADFCQMVHDFLEGCSFVFLGAKFDVDIGNKAAEHTATFSKTLNLIGETNVAEAVSAIKVFDYFFSFPSGLGILGDVVDTPTLMFLPSPHHDLLKDTYADPINIQNGRHLNVMYCSPEEALGIWMMRGLNHLGVKSCNS